MSWLMAPKTPDLAKTTALQQGATDRAQRGSLVNQSGPLGSLTYTSSIDPNTGAPVYTANSQLSGPQQHLLDVLQQTQGGAQDTSNKLFNSVAGMYGAAPNFDDTAQGMTGRMMERWSKQMDPHFKFGMEHLDARLRSQGLIPGTPAYDNEMRTLRNQQSGAVSQFLAQVEPEAYKQAITNYQMPFNMVQQLAQFGSPANLKGSFVDTGAAGVQAPNIMGFANENYKNQLAKYNADMTGFGNMGASVAGMLMI